MEQNNDDKKQTVLTGVKDVTKIAMHPIKVMIWSVIATILPYILVGILIFIIILCIYFGTLEQIDEIVVEGTKWEERIGNAISLYGFKTNEELDKDEEGKFFNMLNLYREFFKFDNYELSILSQTLLFEGSNEERIYLSEDVDLSEKYQLGDDSSNIFWSFVKNISSNYQRGFLTTYAGQSQYLKANKNMLVNAVALRKCKVLTNDNRTKEEQCYKGYLVAEYNIVTDYFVDCYYGDKNLFCDFGEAIETDVEEGFLVLKNNFFGEVTAGTNEILDIRNDIVNWFSSFSIVGSITKKFITFEENARYAITLLVHGTLADENAHHFYYDGYIVNNLKEEYKVRKNTGYDNINNLFGTDGNDFASLVNYYDKDIVEKERKNRKETGDDILEYVYDFFELTYGPDKLEEELAEIIASNESGASVVIDDDGNSISFDDYVLIISLANYSEKIKEIIESGQNVNERLRALMIIARTQVYSDTGFNVSSAEVLGDKDLFKSGQEIYDELKNNSKYSKYLAALSTAISGSRGKTIKVDGKITNLNQQQIDQILEQISSGGTMEDVIKNIIPNASLNVSFSPLPDGSYRITEQYGASRGGESHNAIDYGAANGTKISAIVDGVVVSTNNSCSNNGYYGSDCGGGFGNNVVIQYGNYYIIYAHMYPGSIQVSVGDTIQAGQYIGQVGNSGSSTGSHLHLEVRIDGWNKGAQTEDPNKFINGG